MDPKQAEKAVHGEDAFALAEQASSEELARLKLAEELFELRYQRRKRQSRFAIAAQSMVALVAVGGFFVNAYQSYVNKQQQQHQAEIDQDRWNREFERAQRSDKYRAFFETTALVTDETNPNKRLVGYALLQEFVEDKDYNAKATLLLEEALLQEFRRHTEGVGEEEHRVAVTAILRALSQTSDCRALERAAKSIDRVTQHREKTGDAEEEAEVFREYVRKVLGRAALVCPSFAEFDQVRQPLRSTLQKNPDAVHLTGPVKVADANRKLAEVLRSACEEEVAVSATSDCQDVAQHYQALCAGAPAKVKAAEQPGCKVMSQPFAVVAVAGAPDAGAPEASTSPQP